MKNDLFTLRELSWTWNCARCPSNYLLFKIHFVKIKIPFSQPLYIHVPIEIYFVEFVSKWHYIMHTTPIATCLDIYETEHNFHGD